MSDVTRRQLLAGFLGGLSQAVGTVVVASAVLRTAHAEEKAADTLDQTAKDLQARADKVAAEQGSLEGDEESHLTEFVNGGFRKGGFVNGGGGFHNGGFANGGFRKGGFENGGFRKGGFENGGFRKGGFENGGFRKGGFENGGFRNGGFRNF